MNTVRISQLSLLLASCLLVSACDDDDPAGLSGVGTVVIQFENVVDGAAVGMNTASHTNAAGNSYTITKLEYVVSDLVLSGTAPSVSAMGPHYADEGAPATMSLTIADVPAGEYDALDFVWGLAGATNTTGAFPDLDANGMAWPAMMGGGYHYMRNEGTFTATGGGTSNFTTHTGPTMGNDYSFAVMLGLPATVRLNGGETATITVQMDVNEWYTDPNNYDFNDYGVIMPDMAAQMTLRANGASVWSAVSATVN